MSWKTEIEMGRWCRQDMRILEVKNCKVTLDSDEWAKLLKKARAHQGLSSQ